MTPALSNALAVAVLLIVASFIARYLVRESVDFLALARKPGFDGWIWRSTALLLGSFHAALGWGLWGIIVAAAVRALMVTP